MRNAADMDNRKRGSGMQRPSTRRAEARRKPRQTFEAERRLDHNRPVLPRLQNGAHGTFLCKRQQDVSDFVEMVLIE
jgi:hypothetical protein